MTPSIRKIIEEYLRSWAHYHRHGQDPGIGYPSTNTLKRIMKPNPGDDIDRVPAYDWSDVERLDKWIQLMIFLDPPMGWAVVTSALWGRARMSRQVERYNYVMRDVEVEGPAWKDKRYDFYRRKRDEGVAFLGGLLAEKNQFDKLANRAA